MREPTLYELYQFAQTPIKVDFTSSLDPSTQGKAADDFSKALNDVKNELQAQLTEIEQQLKEAESHLIRAILNIEKNKYNENEQASYAATTDALRAFQSYRLCITRATSLHAVLYGTSSEPLFPFEHNNAADDNQGWNQNIETTFEAASLTYAPLLLLDIFKDAKTELQIAKRRFRRIDAGAWLTINLTNVIEGKYSANVNADQMSTFVAGSLFLGYTIDLCNQLWLDTIEKKLNSIEKSKIKTILNKINDADIIEQYKNLDLNKEIVPAAQFEIYQNLKNRCAQINEQTLESEFAQLKILIKENINQLDEALDTRHFLLQDRLNKNQFYAATLFCSAIILLVAPIAICGIVFATLMNQMNAIWVIKFNYVNDMSRYKNQIEYLNSVNTNVAIDDKKLVSLNLRPLNKGENLTHYIAEQKFNIQAKINETNRQAKLHTSWHLMNMSIVIILLTCPVANLGFAFSLIAIAFYLGAKKYCDNKNTQEKQDANLYTKALCRMYSSDNENNTKLSKNDDHSLTTVANNSQLTIQ